jgi:hypothetical protein
MLFSVVAIIFSIVSFFHPWFFIGSIIAIVLAVGEYILELTHADLFDSPAIGVSAIVLGIAALVLTIISIIVGLGNVGSSGRLLIEALI